MNAIKMGLLGLASTTSIGSTASKTVIASSTSNALKISALSSPVN